MKTIYFTVISDLTFDQRMKRICTSLSAAGYNVVLVGTKVRTSVSLATELYRQHRISCSFSKGKLFYIEFNIKLFFFLLFKKMDAICAIDLDTIVPCYSIARLKRIKKVYDAHELFCEMKEVVSRPSVYAFWKRIEKWLVPRFTAGYTVSTPIAEEFRQLYQVDYEVIRNIPVLIPEKASPLTNEAFILYQGAVNEGRSFETLIPAMQHVTVPLIIYGTGNFMEQALALTQKYELEDKVMFKGNTTPALLKEITPNATIGITLFDRDGLSNYYSLANRFFDYLHAGVPQLCVDYPAYREINNKFEVALLIDDLSPENIARQINLLLTDRLRYQKIKSNCVKARTIYNWQEEEKKLLAFYQKLFA